MLIENFWLNIFQFSDLEDKTYQVKTVWISKTVRIFFDEFNWMWENWITVGKLFKTFLFKKKSQGFDITYVYSLRSLTDLKTVQGATYFWTQSTRSWKSPTNWKKKTHCQQTFGKESMKARK